MLFWDYYPATLCNWEINELEQVAFVALLFLVYFFGILTVKQWEIMINNLLFSAINEETPYEQLLHYWFIVLSMLIEYQLQFYFDQVNVQTTVKTRN